MAEFAGGCHCANITMSVELTREPSSYSPRACDCEFCRRHGAAWVSDPQGALLLRVRDQRDTGRYAQGDEIAEMLLCRNCGVLVAALWQGPHLYGVVNVNSLEARASFAAPQPASPKSLSAEGKVSRWQKIWFADVSVVNADSGEELRG
jgi:hypothetical protein